MSQETLSSSLIDSRLYSTILILSILAFAVLYIIEKKNEEVEAIEKKDDLGNFYQKYIWIWVVDILIIIIISLILIRLEKTYSSIPAVNFVNAFFSFMLFLLLVSPLFLRNHDDSKISQLIFSNVILILTLGSNGFFQFIYARYKPTEALPLSIYFAGLLFVYYASFIFASLSTFSILMRKIVSVKKFRLTTILEKVVMWITQNSYNVEFLHPIILKVVQNEKLVKNKPLLIFLYIIEVPIFALALIFTYVGFIIRLSIIASIFVIEGLKNLFNPFFKGNLTKITNRLMVLACLLSLVFTYIQLLRFGILDSIQKSILELIITVTLIPYFLALLVDKDK